MPLQLYCSVVGVLRHATFEMEYLLLYASVN